MGWCSLLLMSTVATEPVSESLLDGAVSYDDQLFKSRSLLLERYIEVVRPATFSTTCVYPRQLNVICASGLTSRVYEPSVAVAVPL